MANNLRVLSINAVSNVLIKASFTDPLVKNISVDNVTIISQTPGVPSPEVLKTRVVENVLEITLQPLTSLAAYFAVFQSTDEIIFKSLNGTSILFEDGVANRIFFLGPIESTNVVKEYFLNYLRENVYNTEGTVLSSYMNVLSTVLSSALYDVRQLKNENYLSVTVEDEQKMRGATAFDHLNEEGAYEILRVGKTPTDALSSLTLSIDEFTSDPISLLKADYSENLTVNSVDRNGTFNINTFALNLSKRFITKLKSVTFTYSNGHLPYTYDISAFGYQILDPKYDTSYAFKYVLLEDNQVKLSDKILEDVDFSTDSIFQVQVSYEYKDTGRVINPDTVSVEAVLSSGREVLPPLRNVFNLKHAPIVTTSNRIGSIGDIEFVDQNTLPVLDSEHSAFTTELKFRLDFMPSNPGEYSIDYETGTVYVYGADATNDGAGASPPLAIYSYRLNYKENIDWVLDESTSDLVALPTGNLIDAEAVVSFDYEQVLAKDIDYKTQVHREVLDERVGNDLVALNALKVQNSPITNVFRVYNETSGEIYGVSRWNDSKVFFTYNTPPKIEEISGERVSFEEINNEVMFVSSVVETASPSVNIFKIQLNNNNIMAQSEDCIGSSFNTTVSLSNNTIFETELYFNRLQSESDNLARLTEESNYFIDYLNGVIYVAVSSAQDFNIGTVSYKRGYVAPVNSHITSVEDIYYRINSLSSKEKHFDYTEFDDGFVIPESFDLADEHELSNDSDSPYVMSSGEIGAFVDSTFINTVTDSIQFIRNIYESDDLLNNSEPINFAEAATFTDKSITVSSLETKEYHNVEFDGTDYYVTLNKGLSYLSTNITLDIAVVRLSDSQDLWDVSGIVELGSLIKLVLSGTGSPVIGDSVLVTYAYSINDLSHVIVDYNKGEYYLDYSALTDEIIVSYEYGNNALDFRESTALNANETYYVTYKVGALRDALLKNFGSLIDIEILNTFDITFTRERYRDALMAAMHSFSQGPTLTAIKNIAETISHLPAEVDESVFESWSLGYSLLNPRKFETSGEFELTPVKYGDGLMIDKPDQTIGLPVISNIKLEEGTFEAWIRPNWDGLDNQAEIKITPLKDGYTLSELEIFIGALEYHPTFETDAATGKSFFTLDKTQNVEGTPNKSKDGMYIYYDDDTTGTFKRWFLEVVDGYANDGDDFYDGYADGYVNKRYAIAVSTNGRFYDIKSTVNPQPSSSKITSGTNTFNFVVNTGFPNEAITFLADLPHYILDFAEEETKNRFSIFKDESGYLNFRIFDKLKNSYTVSANVSDWKQGELHHVATSWKVNTKMMRDELHLFIDGFEVPNIIRYGDRVKPYLHEKFRTVNPEEVVGLITRNIVGSNDLSTLNGSTQVVSSLNFSSYGINVGDTIYIEESGFDSAGYGITNVNGNTLTLDTVMSLTITDGTFSVNKTSFDVGTEIDVFPNFAVALMHSFIDEVDLETTSGSNVVTSSATDFVAEEVVAGDVLRVDHVDFEKHYTIVSVATNSLTLSDDMPSTLTGLSFSVYRNEEEEIPGLRALQPSYEISKSTDGYYTNILTIRDKALVNDLVMIRTLGINHRRVRRRYYVWGDSSNILKTKLPSPISLDEVRFSKVLLASTYIGPSNSTLSSGVFHSNNIITDQPSNNAAGRTLSISIHGDNLDFSTAVTVDVAGIMVDSLGNYTLSTETLTFNERGTQDTINLFGQVNFIQVHCKPLRTTSNAAVVEVKEKYSLTQPENVGLFELSPSTVPQATVRYSYQVGVGNTLETDGYLVGDGYTVTDENRFFSSSVVDNYLVINNPLSVSGFYKITAVSEDHKSLTIEPTIGLSPLPAFSDGYYEILNTTDYRNGLQNGYFTFEYKGLPGQPYVLKEGLYELDYYTYLSIPFDIGPNDMFIGSDFRGNNQLHGSIDEMQILNVKLTDTRIGETAARTQRTITKEYNSVKASEPDLNNLVLTHFDTLPLTNEANIYRFAEKNVIQAGNVINDNFTQSIVLAENPLVVDNDGILDTKKEATIEFWVNPMFDSGNDPNYRFYFDAFGSVTETLVSTNSTTINLAGTASEVLNVRLEVQTNDINYFAGGELSNGGSTLLLHNELPNQNSNVIVTYIPKGLKGDRVSIFKDTSGYINFNIRANELDYLVRAPIFWARNTWHRVKASYKINGGKSLDEMHLFLDGYERGNVLYGSDLIFGDGVIFGSSFSGPNTVKHNIKFTDSINQFFIGSDSNRGNQAYCLVDNFRISNISRPLYQPFGEPIDPNYSSNLDAVHPITEDLYTTFLLNFDSLVVKNDDFAVLNNRSSGLADFSVNVLDSLGIINNNSKVKEVLEALIKSFKPANSRAFINYV
jgi:hypothetical protein